MKRTPILDRAEFVKGKDLGTDFALVKGGEFGAVLKGQDALRAFLLTEKAQGGLTDEQIEKAVDETSAEEVSFAFTLSTKSPDRQGDTIDQAGWDLANYRKNPVVLWAHDYEQLPVARASATYIAGDRLKAVDRFSNDHELARTVAALYQKGFLSAVSVGFRPKKWAWNEERGGMAADFFECELLEHSCVPVPAHQDALIEARSLGLSIGPVLKWAEALIERSDAGLFVPRDVLKRAVSDASTRIVVDFGDRKSLIVSEHVTPAAVPVEPAEISVEAAMSRIAKAGFAVVDPAALAQFATARKQATEEPVAAAVVPEEPKPSEPAEDPLLKLLAEDSAGLRDLIRDEIGSDARKRLKTLSTTLTGRLDLN